MNESLTSYVHLHFVVYDESIRVRAEFSRRLCACSEQKTHLKASERLIAFISSTDLCVIGSVGE